MEFTWQKLGREELEILSSLDLSGDPSNQAALLQTEINIHLYELYSTGAVIRDGVIIEKVDTDQCKAATYAQRLGQEFTDKHFSLLDLDSSFNPQSLHEFFNWLNHVRLGILRTNRFLVSLKHFNYVPDNLYLDLVSTPIFGHVFKAFGLIYFAQLFIDFGAILYSTFIPSIKTHEEHLSTWERLQERFSLSFYKEGRPMRMLNCIGWGSLNLAAYLVGGPWLIITGFAYDIVQEISKAIISLAPHGFLLWEVHKQIKKTNPDNTAELQSLKLIQKELAIKTAKEIGWQAYKIVCVTLICVGMTLTALVAAGMIASGVGTAPGIALLAAGLTLTVGSVFNGLGMNVVKTGYNACKSFGNWCKSLYKSSPPSNILVATPIPNPHSTNQTVAIDEPIANSSSPLPVFEEVHPSATTTISTNVIKNVLTPTSAHTDIPTATTGHSSTYAYLMPQIPNLTNTEVMEKDISTVPVMDRRPPKVPSLPKNPFIEFTPPHPGETSPAITIPSPNRKRQTRVSPNSFLTHRFHHSFTLGAGSNSASSPSPITCSA